MLAISQNVQLIPHFSSPYNSPRLINAVSYSRTAASDVMEGGLEMISLYCVSAFRGSVFVNFLASWILTESAGAILMYGKWVRRLGSYLDEAIPPECK